jgi:hypothetical protein
MDISNFSVGAVKSVAFSADGKTVLLDAIDQEGAPFTLTFPAEQMMSLLISLSQAASQQFPRSEGVMPAMLANLFEKQSAIMSANHTATMVTDLATITLLIDKGHVSIGEAAQRIEEIRRVLVGDSTLVDDRIQRLTRWLRDHDKPQRRGWKFGVIRGGLDQDRTSDQDRSPK